MDIYLKKAALHIVDRESGDPIFSQSELDLTKEYVRDYLTKKIQKLSSAQTKTGTLTEDSTFALLSQQAEHDFLSASERLVSRWYEAYKESEEAPSADAFVALYEEDTQMYLAFLKVN
ncbi:MAG: nucleoid-associated protein, partial [Enterococcus sp.]|nr:nucleoid-associated protein [Enterococcus sp.]